MKILNAKQIRKADQATIKNEPISSIDLMERAAYRCLLWIQGHNFDDRDIHIFCGMGNNGGDGLALARMLFKEDYMTGTYVVHFSDSMSDDFVTNYQRAEEVGIHPGSIHSAEDFPVIREGDIVIDAIFGIGLNKPPRGIAKEVIEYINNSGVFVLSIDIPSGLYIDKPLEENQAVIQANVSLTFQTPKLAFLLPQYEKYIDVFIILNIGLDKAFIDKIPTNYHYTTAFTVSQFYKMRKRFSHKGSFGHSLIIGGSFGKIGATVLASKAALKIGSGLVTAYIPKCGYTVLQTAIPEVMVEVDAEYQLEFFNFKVKPSVIGLGIGMGTSDKTSKALGKFLKNNDTPLVIDADGLNILSNNKEFLDYLPVNTILTPHPKELERLIGNWKDDYEKLKKVKNFSKKYKCILVVKGAHTLVVQNNQFYFNSSGSPALATAGTGDVLTGIITGLIAQSYSPLEASLFGVYVHGKTTEFVDSFGVQEIFMASDILKLLPEAMESVINTKDEYIDLSKSFKDIDDEFPDDYFFDDNDPPPF